MRAHYGASFTPNISNFSAQESRIASGSPYALIGLEKPKAWAGLSLQSTSLDNIPHGGRDGVSIALSTPGLPGQPGKRPATSSKGSSWARVANTARVLSLLLLLVVISLSLVCLMVWQRFKSVMNRVVSACLGSRVSTKAEPLLKAPSRTSSSSTKSRPWTFTSNASRGQ